MLTPADLLAAGLHLPPLPDPPLAVVDTHCAITGQPIAAGYPVVDMVTGATAEFLDCFRGGLSGYVSEPAARCFKSANPRAGNPCARSVAAFADGWLANPLIAREQALAQNRPWWSNLARAIWPERAGQPCLFILTTDTKKRLWIRARIGTLGTRTALLYYDGKTAGNEVLYLDWPRLLECLALTEEVYAAGFPKVAIRESLYVAGKITGLVGLARTGLMDRALAPWRGSPELLVASLIAQKEAPIITPEEDPTSWQALPLFAPAP